MQERHMIPADENDQLRAPPSALVARMTPAGQVVGIDVVPARTAMAAENSAPTSVGVTRRGVPYPT